jgi:hypothetical protein
MTDIERVRAFVESRIREVYRRPLMFGRDAEGVECALRAYHDVWAEIVDPGANWFETWREVKARRDFGPLGAARYFRTQVPGGATATEAEAAVFVVDFWREVDEALGLKISNEERA